VRLNSTILGITVLVLIFGGIGVSMVTDTWVTESTKTAAPIKEGEFAGQANPADIRGSYTLADVGKNFGIPVPVLAKALGVEGVADQAAFKAKDLEIRYASLDKEIGTTSLRLFVALYKGLPYDLTGDTYIPVPAVEILKQAGKLTADQLKYIEAHAVDVGKVK